MDTKLVLLKNYLDSKLKDVETGSGSETLDFRILCNDEPGVINLICSAATPPSEYQIWYDLEKFYERDSNSWVELLAYKDSFASTIIDLGNGDESLPKANINIIGPSEISSDEDCKYEILAYYRNRAYSVKAKWELSQFNIGTIDSSGVFNLIPQRTSCKIAVIAIVVFQGLESVLFKDVIVKATTMPIPRSLAIVGENSVEENNSSDFTAILTYSEGSTSDVTDTVTWSVNKSPQVKLSAATVVNGKLSVGAGGNVNITLNAYYNFLDANGGSLSTSKIITVQKSITPSGLTVNGPVSVTDFVPAKYIAEVELSDGTTQEITSKCLWESGTYAIGESINDVVWRSDEEIFDNGILLLNQNSSSLGGIGIKASYVLNGVKAICINDILAISASPPIVKSLEIIGPSIITANGTFRYVSVATLEDGSIIDYSYQSSLSTDNESIATTKKYKLSTLETQADTTINLSNVVGGVYNVSGSVSVTVKPVPETLLADRTPMSISLYGSTFVNRNRYYSYNAIVTFADGTIEDVTLSSDLYWRQTITNTPANISYGILDVKNANLYTFARLEVSYTLSGKTITAFKNVLIK